MKKFLSCAIAVAAMGISGSASAATSFSASLTGAQQAFPNASAATGLGSIVVSADSNSMFIGSSWAGLSNSATQLRVHCCSIPGATSPPVFNLTPSATTSGAFGQANDLTLLSTYSSGFAGSETNPLVLRAKLLTGLTSGLAYFNLFSATFPAGEIRGNLSAGSVPGGAVPEPSTWAMMIAGFGMIGGAMRQRRRILAV